MIFYLWLNRKIDYIFSIFVLERSGVFIEEDSDCSLIIWKGGMYFVWMGN